ncbi:hypothetical protein N7676_00370 [Stenotrophomonas sp. GD03993]|uniref:head-tail joining protein n=1 Tax=unclassified Stenotrophomonas TaxID=196198 RepID=UPI002448B941|nr:MULTISPECIES: hypothetical protein [unclassified Stenotrophomonas]HDS1631583.1 hypothetical protein [Stenotrophomonas maltophilia]MDH0185900.1 hypothetical protein [Stenotrophomonas sp. GD04051]MDH0462266.1 hypothetical protein [Stenotrophomonas sp. GD03993]MDH0875069.1 hypothetical protein [Stenotrophomonas sp. GD03877]MDH2154655.1 hypothetical protein [Stenotrophomonas sp. GD03657]
MNELDFLRDMDATIHGAFSLAGMVSTSKVTSEKSGTVTDGVRVYVDRDVETIGELRQFVSGRVEVSYLRADIEVEQGDRVEVAGEVFVNMKKLSDDGSRSRWLVRRG